MSLLMAAEQIASNEGLIACRTDIKTFRLICIWFSAPTAVKTKREKGDLTIETMPIKMLWADKPLVAPWSRACISFSLRHARR
jgi:hypothetical protein